ncbi:MAG: hypothetical protein OIN88_15860 [Candidatus Methanoperedens sp.]|nr:hypothetical protein [Candidatus Methanoperedens sp.]
MKKEKTNRALVHWKSVIGGVILWFFTRAYLSTPLVHLLDIKYRSADTLFVLIAPFITCLIETFLAKRITKRTVISMVITLFIVAFLNFLIDNLTKSYLTGT